MGIGVGGGFRIFLFICDVIRKEVFVGGCENIECCISI